MKAGVGYIFVLCLSLLSARGAEHPRAGLRFEQILPDHGLAHSQVTDIIQDKQGFMWFTTHGGLCRYDGAQFITYQENPFEQDALSSNLAGVIHEGRDGSIWVGTANGLNLFDRGTETFEKWLANSDHQNIVAITDDWNGMVWAGTTKGLARLNPDTNQISFQPEFEGLHIRALIRDQLGAIWVSTKQGVFHLDPDKLQSIQRPLGDEPAQPLITTFHEDPNGFLWMGHKKGLYRLAPKNGEIDTWLGQIGKPGPNPTDIRSIYHGNDGSLWVATSNGLYRMDEKRQVFKRYQHDAANPQSLSDNFLGRVFEDSFGVLWVTMPGRGLARADTLSSKFDRYTRNPLEKNTLSSSIVSGLYKDDKGILWIGTFDRGLNRFDRRTGSYTHFRHDPNDPDGMISDTVSYLDGHGTELFVGTSYGLFVMDTESYRFRAIPSADGPVHRIFSFNRVSNDSVWVGAHTGLYLWDRRTEMLTRQSSPDQVMVVRSIVVDSRSGSLWLGTQGTGLVLFDPSSGIVRNWRRSPENTGGPSNDLILSLVTDTADNNILWLGTYGGGLNRFDTTSHRTRVYTQLNSGICSNEIYGIRTDEKGHLWISTSRGLSRFNPTTEVFANYDVGDGLQAMEFSTGAFFRAADGEMLFGGINGFNSFYPDHVRDNPIPPKVALTGFLLSNQPVLVGSDSPLKEPIGQVKTITLSHKQNDISFDFATLHFSRPEKNTHAFILENYEDHWNQAGSERSARYTNLDPGIYRFRVKGTNGDGVPNKKDAEVQVIINPPWWQTNWAYGFYILLGVALALAIDHVQRDRFIQKERSKAEMEQARLRAEAAESNALAAQAQAHALQSEYKRKEAERMLLEAENTRKTRELEEARRLQLSMLPESLPTPPNVEIAVHMETATEVGGDYYDFKTDDEGRLIAAIGDATGHGLQAGTMVAATKSLFNAMNPTVELTRFLLDASHALEAMGFKKMYMALMLARLEGTQLSVVCAGMPSIILLRAGSDQAEEIRQRGMPLGVPFDYPYEEQTVTVEPGDTILLMSDGFQELFNPMNEMLGLPRLIEWFSEMRDSNPQEIIDQLVERGMDWAQGRIQDDDITFMVLRIK